MVWIRSLYRLTHCLFTILPVCYRLAFTTLTCNAMYRSVSVTLRTIAIVGAKLSATALDHICTQHLLGCFILRVCDVPFLLNIPGLAPLRARTCPETVRNQCGNLVNHRRGIQAISGSRSTSPRFILDFHHVPIVCEHCKICAESAIPRRICSRRTGRLVSTGALAIILVLYAHLCVNLSVR